ncbi:MAG: 5-formyltetrahydrofolate cyclo-ligase [Gammaproteobacteria bacterium]
MNGHDDSSANPPASAPCAMHEVDAAYMGLSGVGAPRPAAQLAAWRKATREQLIAARLAVPAATRRQFDRRIAQTLQDLLGDLADRVVSAYWPFRGEVDLRPWLTDILAHGAQAALPVVIAQGKPMVFRVWTPGTPMTRGVWNIPIPAAEAATVIPDVVIAPVVGFDADCYRLGYGGGFFDRTLAELPRRPRFVGVGHDSARLPTIHPQGHDIAMDAVVTEAGVVTPRVGSREA